jgi:catechol 2,3-dioxygenase-like lactoylglutathione lyase family enzyme
LISGAIPATIETELPFRRTAPVRSHHHLTLCVGGAQEDYDFHVKTLGLRNVKKTLLYDGKVPIYHLYYGNDVVPRARSSPAFQIARTDAIRFRPWRRKFREKLPVMRSAKRKLIGRAD